MTIHSISKTILLRAGIDFAMWAGATALFQGRVNGFEQEPTAAATEVAERMNALELSMTVKADEEGKLYWSVTALDLHTMLTAQGFEVERKQMLRRFGYNL